VIVPLSGREIILNQLHDTHPGITKMKMLARSYMWWPGIDSDIQRKVQECNICQLNRSIPSKAPLHSWDIPKKPWSRRHIDHAGPFLGKLFLVVVDAHSKWLEVKIVNSTSSEVTIKNLQQIFATHGLPAQIVSDNSTSFTSHEFKSYVNQHGIHHILTSPYHPSSNGLAERAVQTFKSAIKKLEGNIETRLIQFLARYRVTPHTTTETSPAELLMGRKLRTTLDLLHPDISCKVSTKQEKLNKSDKPLRSFNIGDNVFARNYDGKSKWLPATVIQITGPRSYHVQTSSNIVLRRHIDQLRTRYCKEDNNTTFTNEDLDKWSFPTSVTNERDPENIIVPPLQPPTPQPNTPIIRRSNRIRRPVEKFGPYVN
jgi:transposase InsO family protein